MAVTSSDIATTLLRSTASVTDVEDLAWSMWITDAYRQIERRLGSLDDLVGEDVDYVVREAVALKAKRPDEATKVDVSVDDASTSRTYERSTGQVTILDEWWTLLSPAVDSSVGYSTRPTFEADTGLLESLGWGAVL